MVFLDIRAFQKNNANDTEESHDALVAVNETENVERTCDDGENAICCALMALHKKNGRDNPQHLYLVFRSLGLEEDSLLMVLIHCSEILSCGDRMFLRNQHEFDVHQPLYHSSCLVQQLLARSLRRSQIQNSEIHR